MSLARFTAPADIIATELQAGRRGQRITGQADPDTLDRIASLLRQGLTRGIKPQWTLRCAIGVTFDQSQLNEIAEQVEEAFVSGEFPLDWRVDIYE